MIHIVNIHISEIETTSEYVKRSGSTTVHLVEAPDQDGVANKVLAYYANKETEAIKYEIEFLNIYETIT